MQTFSYRQVASVPDAISAGAVAADANTRSPVQYFAGGTTLLDLMKLGVMQPRSLVDLAGLRAQHSAIEASASGLFLGGLARMAEVADHPAVLRDYPAIAQSLQLAASPQLRNMASVAGNVLQRTRCSYFRDASWYACNKREPGTGCAAIGGESRQLAVLGVSQHCIANYPGDFANALVALAAEALLTSPEGDRTLPVEELHRLPGDTPHLETNLKPGELITGFRIPAAPWTRRSRYVKVRDRQSYAFALASAAVALDMDGSTVREARIALGGIAAKPWRAHEAEDLLKGQELTQETAGRAAEAAFQGAVTDDQTAYKPELGRRTLVRALLETAALEC